MLTYFISVPALRANYKVLDRSLAAAYDQVKLLTGETKMTMKRCRLPTADEASFQPRAWIRHKSIWRAV